MTYNPKTAPMISAADAVAQGQTYWSVISAARFHERQATDRRGRDGALIPANPASATLARRLRALAAEVATLAGLNIRKYRGHRPANDNKRRPERRAA